MSDSAEEDLNAPPLKKARYHWQVKSSSTGQRKNCGNDDGNENGDSSHSGQHEASSETEIFPNHDHSSNDTIKGSSAEEFDDEMFLFDGDKTDLKILDTVRKYVTGQTSKIVQNAFTQKSISNHDDTINKTHQQNNSHISDSSGTTDQSKHSIDTVDHFSERDCTSQPTETIDNLTDEALSDNSPITVSNENRRRPGLDYIMKWQSQQKAKAIVDNAINMTLEEMGLTPNLDHNLPILERLHVEDESINEAIRHRGLYPQDNQDEVLQGTITPLFQQLTQVSDSVFADRLNSMRLFITIRQTSQNPDGVTETPLEWTDELAIRTLQSRSEGVGYENDQPSDDIPIPDQAFQLSLNSNPPQASDNDESLSTAETNEEYYQQSDLNNSHETRSPSHLSALSTDNISNDESVSDKDSSLLQVSVSDERNEINSLNCDSGTHDDGDSTNEIMEDNDVINYALDAAINAKGLALKNE